jgi:HEAT repeat protein
MNARETVKKLDDLRQNLDAQLQLIMMGEEAVDPLIEFLSSAPTLHPQPRCLAAEALGAIGGARAIEVLAYIPDPRVPGALLSLLSSGRRTLHWKARWALQRLGRTTEPSRSP